MSSNKNPLLDRAEFLINCVLANTETNARQCSGRIRGRALRFGFDAPVAHPDRVLAGVMLIAPGLYPEFVSGELYLRSE